MTAILLMVSLLVAFRSGQEGARAARWASPTVQRLVFNAALLFYMGPVLSPRPAPLPYR